MFSIVQLRQYIGLEGHLRVGDRLRKGKFNYDLYHSDIAEALNNDNAKTACEHFFSRFQNNYDQSFPIKSKTLTYKDILKPWINDISIKRIKIRDNLKKLARKKLIKRKIYTDFRNKVTNELNSAKTK